MEYFWYSGVQPDVIPVDGIVRPVITARKRRPIVSLQRCGKSRAAEEGCHGCQLAVFRIGHGGNHIFHVLEASAGIVHSHNLADSPGRALQRGVTIFIDGECQAVILVGTPSAISAWGGVADIAVVVLSVGQPVKDVSLKQDLRTTVRRGAYLGLRSTILAGITVGEFAIVAAGSVVTADVPPYTMVAGVPARVVREFGPEDVA